MKTKYRRSVVFVMAVSLLLLSAEYALAITDLGQTPSFISKTLLVKLTPQARANLKVTGENVNPVASGLPSLDAICRDHGVTSFRSIMASGAHRDAAAAINSWHKLTLAGSEQRLTLIEQSNDDELNLAYSGAEPLGRLMERLKQDTNVES